MRKKITEKERWIAEKFPTFVFKILAYLNRQARRSATGYTIPSSRLKNPKTGPGRIGIIREFLSY